MAGTTPVTTLRELFYHFLVTQTNTWLHLDALTTTNEFALHHTTLSLSDICSTTIII